MLLCQHVSLYSLKNQKGPLELKISLTLMMTAEPESCCEEANHRERFSVVCLSTVESLSGVLCTSAGRNDCLLFLL